MKVHKTKLIDCFIIEPDIFRDDRGFFLETFQKERYFQKVGINLPFVQDNFSKSSYGILRGLHFQKNKPQGKLVTVSHGEVFDVAVDLRKDSKSFGKWDSVILSAKNMKQFWVPPGFAHGFLVLSEFAHFQYKCTDFYDKDDEGSIVWNDNFLDINWPITKPILSDKDFNAPNFNSLFK